MLLTVLGYWQYLRMSGMCYWLYCVTDISCGGVECVTDCTGLLIVLEDEWNVLLTVVSCWQYLGMSEMCYWLYWVTDSTWRWVECVTDCTGLLTVLEDEWNVLLTKIYYWLTGLLTILGCWMHLGYWMEYPTDRTELLIGPTYWLYRVAGWTWLLTVHTLLLTRLDRAVGSTRLLVGLTPIFLASKTDWTGVLVILHWDRNAGSIDSLAISVYCGLMSGLFIPWSDRINQLVTRLKSSKPLTGMPSIRIDRDPAFWQLQSADSGSPPPPTHLPNGLWSASPSPVTRSNIYKKLNFIR
jgi:hypothetical protein